MVIDAYRTPPVRSGANRRPRSMGLKVTVPAHQPVALSHP